ncbi:MAG TPA: hypothetical protein VIY48_03075 [Candidatus Paceibacterota bacterium]
MIDDATILEKAHRMATKYKHTNDEPYRFNPRHIVDFARAIEQLVRQEQREEEKDAERYRALIASGKYCPSSIGGYWALATCCANPITKAEMDEAVDKAIRAAGKENSDDH